MKREDVAHLATLARIELSEPELAKLPDELSSIVSYVSVITDITGDAADTAPKLGARFNIFRSDVVTTTTGEHTEALLAEMPAHERNMLVVKKILSND